MHIYYLFFHIEGLLSQLGSEGVILPYFTSNVFRVALLRRHTINLLYLGHGLACTSQGNSLLGLISEGDLGL